MTRSSESLRIAKKMLLVIRRIYFTVVSKMLPKAIRRMFLIVVKKMLLIAIKKMLQVTRASQSCHVNP